MLLFNLKIQEEGQDLRLNIREALLTMVDAFRPESANSTAHVPPCKAATNGTGNVSNAGSSKKGTVFTKTCMYVFNHKVTLKTSLSLSIFVQMKTQVFQTQYHLNYCGFKCKSF